MYVHVSGFEINLLQPLSKLASLFLDHQTTDMSVLCTDAMEPMPDCIVNIVVIATMLKISPLPSPIVAASGLDAYVSETLPVRTWPRLVMTEAGE